MPHVAETALAAIAIAVAHAMDLETTSSLAKELREALAALKAIEPPTAAEVSDLERIRLERDKRTA